MAQQQSRPEERLHDGSSVVPAREVCAIGLTVQPDPFHGNLQLRRPLLPLFPGKFAFALLECDEFSLRRLKKAVAWCHCQLPMSRHACHPLMSPAPVWLSAEGGGKFFPYFYGIMTVGFPAWGKPGSDSDCCLALTASQTRPADGEPAVATHSGYLSHRIFPLILQWDGYATHAAIDFDPQNLIESK